MDLRIYCAFKVSHEIKNFTDVQTLSKFLQYYSSTRIAKLAQAEAEHLVQVLLKGKWTIDRQTF